MGGNTLDEKIINDMERSLENIDLKEEKIHWEKF